MGDKIHFYYPNAVPKIPDSGSGLDCWVLKTFNNLKDISECGPIDLTDKIHDNGIFIFHKGFFPVKIRPSFKKYFVCIQADYGRYRFAQYHIHQNPAGLRNIRFSKRSFFEERIFPFVRNRFIPHWNQENIIGRNKNRGMAFENIFFMGLEKNLPPRFLNPEFSEKLRSYGISLRIVTDSSLWNDYSQADCVISVRDLNGDPHYNKPSSKIINALLAGVPVISGAESSAIYLKEKFKAPIEIISSEETFIQAVLKIKTEYRQYLDAIETGNKSLYSYHDESIRGEWCRILEEIRVLSHKWMYSGAFSRKSFFFFSSV